MLLGVRSAVRVTVRSSPGELSGHAWHILTVMPSRDHRPAAAQPISNDTRIAGRLSEGEFSAIAEKSSSLEIARRKGDSNRGSRTAAFRSPAAVSVPGLMRARRGRSCARGCAGLKCVGHGFFPPFRFAEHGSSLTSAMEIRHHVDPLTPSVTWQPREHRETRWAHGFASPPYDGFAGSGMKNPVEHRTAASNGIVPNAAGIFGFTLPT